ncbi:MAG: hypothetical protein LBD43_00640, partial [Holosporales bacterium]|nr:hypothetical protein [Holosporales bacterium]
MRKSKKLILTIALACTQAGIRPVKAAEAIKQPLKSEGARPKTALADEVKQPKGGSVRGDSMPGTGESGTASGDTIPSGDAGQPRAADGSTAPTDGGTDKQGRRETAEGAAQILRGGLAAKMGFTNTADLEYFCYMVGLHGERAERNEQGEEIRNVKPDELAAGVIDHATRLMAVLEGNEPETSSLSEEQIRRHRWLTIVDNYEKDDTVVEAVASHIAWCKFMQEIAANEPNETKRTMLQAVLAVDRYMARNLDKYDEEIAQAAREAICQGIERRTR